MSDVASLFARIPGQERAVDMLVAAARHPTHAYLLVGPPGVGKRQAAGALAAALLGGADDPDLARRAAAFAHPDVRLYARAGAALSVDDAREIHASPTAPRWRRRRRSSSCPTCTSCARRDRRS